MWGCKSLYHVHSSPSTPVPRRWNSDIITRFYGPRNYCSAGANNIYNINSVNHILSNPHACFVAPSCTWSVLPNQVLQYSRHSIEHCATNCYCYPWSLNAYTGSPTPYGTASYLAMVRLVSTDVEAWIIETMQPGIGNYSRDAHYARISAAWW